MKGTGGSPRKKERNKRKLLTGYSSRKREKARTSRSQIGSKRGRVGKRGGEKHGHDCGKSPIKARGVILENWDSGCSSFLREQISAVEESGQAKESYSSLSLFLSLSLSNPCL